MTDPTPDENVCPASGTPARAGYRGQTVECPECGKSIVLGGDIHESRGIVPRHLKPESERSIPPTSKMRVACATTSHDVEEGECPWCTIERLTLDLERLEKLVYVPGHWKCAKCGFYLVSTNIHIPTSNFSANNEPQQCANGCGPMWRVTERDAGNTAAQRGIDFREKVWAALGIEPTNEDKTLERIRELEKRSAHETSGDVRRLPPGTEVEVAYGDDESPTWERGILVENPEVWVRFDEDGPMVLSFPHKRVRRRSAEKAGGEPT